MLFIWWQFHLACPVISIQHLDAFFVVTVSHLFWQRSVLSGVIQRACRSRWQNWFDLVADQQMGITSGAACTTRVALLMAAQATPPTHKGLANSKES